MKKEFKTKEDELVVVNYNSFTGRFHITYHDKVAYKTGKNYYAVKEDEETHVFHVYGNIFSGINVRLRDNIFVLTDSLPIYAYILGFIPFVMTMVLGNTSILSDYGLYYVGGALGGGISGAFSMLGITLAAFLNKHWLKILFLLLSIVVTFFVCLGIGYLAYILLGSLSGALV